MNQHHDDDDARLPAFSSFLAMQRRGALLAELSEQLTLLVESVGETGRGGELTLTVKVRPNANARGAVEVRDSIKVKAPKFEAPAGVYFTAPGGRLARNDPRQPRLTGVDVGDPA